MNLKTRGFTLVELLVTLVIMAILTGLSIAINLSAQANARDNEREQDIASIARGLETRYNRSYSYTVSGTPYTATAGTYPGRIEINAFAAGNLEADRVFPGTSVASLTSPRGQLIAPLCQSVDNCPVENQALIQNSFSGVTDGYRYEFIGIDNTSVTPCDTDCRRYNLYWISETTSTTTMGVKGLKIYRSKHQ